MRPSNSDEGETLLASLPVAKFDGVGPVTAAKMRALGIETGADLRRQTLDFVRNHFGKSGNWYYNLARGQDDRPVQPDRERKSSGSETTFAEDLTDPGRIEAGVIAMADEVWSWCEKANSRGRTVTVKIKCADFQISTRSRSLETTIETRDRLREVALDLIRSVLPPPLSNLRSEDADKGAELPFVKCSVPLVGQFGLSVKICDRRADGERKGLKDSLEPAAMRQERPFRDGEAVDSTQIRRSSRRMIFPVAVIGSVSTNSM